MGSVNPNSPPLLSVIVCTYNRADLLPGCLEALAVQSCDKKKFEVIVVNNNSTDATQSIAKSYAARYRNFRVIIEPQQGLSHARNCGWRAAWGEFVAYIDDDAKAAPDWCERLLHAFVVASPQPVAVGGEVRPFYDVSPPRWFTDDFEIRTWGKEAHFLQPPLALYGFSGSNMALRKNVLEEYGGFSAEFGMVGNSLGLGEETELFTRIYTRHPWFWYDPAILVYHWTSIKNMKVYYRFRRAFETGETGAHLLNFRFFSEAYVRRIAATIFFVMKLPFSFGAKTESFETQVVKKIEELGHRLGYLCGVFTSHKH